MSFEAERASIESKVSEFVTAPVAYDNVKFDPPDSSPWVRLNILDGTTRFRTLEGATEGAGLIDLQIFIPQNTGTKQLREIADELTTLLTNISIDDVRTKSGSLTTVGQVQGWVQYNLSIPFRRVD